MDILEGLNPAQADAVQRTEGPVLVVAGPGSGKTRVLTHRIAYLIRVCDIRPYHILAVTFTNKAAREMISRLRNLIGEATSQLTVGTFHATCVRILRREADYLNIDSNFVIYDADDQRRLVARILKEMDLDTKIYGPSSVQGAISRAKNDLLTPQGYRPPTYWHEAVARVFERYEESKRENNALDFDDLLQKTEELFREHEEVRKRYQERYLYLLVDEFQDTNKAQYELVHHLAGDKENLFVVGDEDQSIYSWRGADYRNVLRFRSDFHDAQICLLEQNYRSTQTILDAAQAVIDHNAQRTPKNLWTNNDEGEPIRLFEAYDEREEAEYVVDAIQKLVSRGRCAFGECAVMFRTNAQSRALEDAFVRHSVPYKLVGSVRYYQRREIKDVLAYLRLIHNPDDDMSLRRIINVPKRGIGPKTLQQLSMWAVKQGFSTGRALQRLVEIAQQEGDIDSTPFDTRAGNVLLSFGEMLRELITASEESTLSELVHLILEKTRYLMALRDGTEEGSERAENILELFSVTERYDDMSPESALPAFLEEVSLSTDVDQLDWESDTVTLLTLHSAKGLEFDAVFIVGMEEGIFPHSRSMDDPGEMEEERRLCYVGITRARKYLYLVHTFRRTLYGRSEVREPSRFLRDIPSHLVEGRLAPQTKQKGTGKPMTDRRRRRQLLSRRRTEVDRFRKERRSKSDGERKIEKPSATQRQKKAQASSKTDSPDFQPGESVTHPIFGPGTVVASKSVGDDEEVTVAFDGKGVKRLMVSYAKLERP
ncbi:MAG: UvrD-helicase domain-containing protein [Chloroflexota bacterium]|nr:UvrD-helicase domain-containing protein [Chloroflexota bacterium]